MVMNRFLAPATLLMDRLRYPRKFVLLSLLFVVPLALVTILLATRVVADTQFTQRELAGTTYLRPLVALFGALLEQQQASLPAGSTPTTDPAQSILQQRIEQDLRDVAVVDVRFGSSLGTTADFHEIEADWRAMQAHPPTPAANQSNPRSAQLIAETRRLITLVGDSSNLILDPELESYYVMDTLLLKLPESDARVTDLGLLANRIAKRRMISPGDTLQATALIGQISANTNAHRQGLAKVSQANRASGLALADAAEAYFAATADLIEQTQHEVVLAPYSTTIPDKFYATIARVTRANNRLWAQAVIVLDGMLQRRIDGYNQQFMIAAAVIVIGLGLALYFCSGMYRSMMTTIARLDDAAQHMAHGNIIEAVPIESRDELGDVTRVFNQIAAALVTASAQRQAVLENAADGIVTRDDQGQITSLNPAACQMFGTTVEQATGQPLSVMLPGVEMSLAAGAWHVLDGRRSDGTAFPCELTTSSLRGNGMSGAILIVRDVSQLRQVEAERARLQAEIIHAQASALAELSTPLIPITDQLLVMPLIGAIDQQRANQIVETLLLGVERARAQVVILDVTGVLIMDTFVAMALLRAAANVRLLGARLDITGIRPEVAETLVGLGIDLRAIRTYSSLQQGISAATHQ